MAAPISNYRDRTYVFLIKPRFNGVNEKCIFDA